jgi:hypothetical protein
MGQLNGRYTILPADELGDACEGSFLPTFNVPWIFSAGMDKSSLA